MKAIACAIVAAGVLMAPRADNPFDNMVNGIICIIALFGVCYYLSWSI